MSTGDYDKVWQYSVWDSDGDSGGSTQLGIMCKTLCYDL